MQFSAFSWRPLALGIMLVLLIARSSAQMVTYDISNGPDGITGGEFQIVCQPDSYCLLHEDNDFTLFGISRDAIEEDEDRYSPNITYYWNDYISVPTFEGAGCSGGECLITCDEGCTCNIGPDDGIIANDLTQDSNIIETLPDASIPNPDDLVMYGSASQDPDSIAIRCNGMFVDRCNPASISDGYFVKQINHGTPDYDYAMDFTDCNDDDGNFCYIACDPRCSCSETKGNETDLVCAIATAPPTVAPTTDAPTPTPPTTSGGGDRAGKSSFIVAASVPFLAMIAVAFS